jgi:hypothetical protein
MTASKVSPSVRSSITEDGAVLIDIECGKIFSLNPTGGAIWAQIEQGSDLDEIAGTIARSYNIEPSRARADIEQLIGALEEKRLLTRSE